MMRARSVASFTGWTTRRRVGDVNLFGHEDAAGRKNLLLLIQLRWIAVCGQVVTILVVRFGLGVALPFGPMAGVLACLVALNILSLARLVLPAAVANRELFAALMIDVAALTLQFYLTGGATNPFTFLYLLQVTLGAVLLDAWSTCTMVVLTALCFLLPDDRLPSP